MALTGLNRYTDERSPRRYRQAIARAGDGDVNRSETLSAVYLNDQYFRVGLLADTLRLHEDGSGTCTGLVDYEALHGGEGTVLEVPVANEFTFR